MECEKSENRRVLLRVAKLEQTPDTSAQLRLLFDRLISV